MCQNCGVTFSCGCQVRIASDGKSCCNNCVSSYEIQINSSKNNVLSSVNNTAPVITEITYNNVNN